MKKVIFFSFLFIYSFSTRSQNQPNIVLLFADDAGYADFGFHGSRTMKTPHLDKLAKTAMRFTQGYVSDPTCGPSRAGLITGKYQQRFGYEENNVPGFMSENSAALGEEMGLPPQEKTIGNFLKTMGYQTAVFGKWHLGSADRFHPTNRGFDYFYGFRGGARDYFPYEENSKAQIENRLEEGFGDYQEHDGYLTDVLAEKAVAFIENNRKKPFFLYLSFNAVHTPMDAKKEDLKEFPNLSGNRRNVAAMTLAMDRACGAVIDKLEELGLSENTILVFTNDNGGPTDKNASSNYPLSGTKSNHLEGGIRVPLLVKWPGKIEANSVYEQPVSTLDLLPTFFQAAGGEYKDLEGIDGVNLIPYITGSSCERPHQKLFWKKDARAAVREGDWKLIRYPDRPAELYNIVEDERELKNLATIFPDRVSKMYKMIFEWESTLERPRWLLKRKFENVDLDRMDLYRDQSKFFEEERINSGTK